MIQQNQIFLIQILESQNQANSNQKPVTPGPHPNLMQSSYSHYKIQNHQGINRLIDENLACLPCLLLNMLMPRSFAPASCKLDPKQTKPKSQNAQNFVRQCQSLYLFSGRLCPAPYSFEPPFSLPRTWTGNTLMSSPHLSRPTLRAVSPLSLSSTRLRMVMRLMRRLHHRPWASHSQAR